MYEILRVSGVSRADEEIRINVYLEISVRCPQGFQPFLASIVSIT